MDVEKLTGRARGFILPAQLLATREGNRQFTSLHLMKVLLDDEEGQVSGLVERAGGIARAFPAGTSQPHRYHHPVPPCAEKRHCKIVDIQFSRLVRMLEAHKITLRLEAAGRGWLAGKGWQPA